jgi:hypothetical protein
VNVENHNDNMRTLSQVCHFLQQETPNPAVVSGVVVTPKDNVCEKQTVSRKI